MFIPLCIGPVVGVLYNGCTVSKCKYTGCAFILAMFICMGKQLFCNFTKRGEVKDFEYCGGYVGVVYLISRDGLGLIVKFTGSNLVLACVKWDSYLRCHMT